MLLVLAGGAVGAPVRYLVDRWVQREGRTFPVGILAVNVVGSLLLGLLAGAPGLPRWALTLGGTGFCGALTTFSTFSLNTVVLADRGRWAAALGNVALSLGGGLGACALGWWIAAQL